MDQGSDNDGRVTKEEEENMTDVDLVITADWHLRDTVPTCRTDDFLSAMWRKVEFVEELAEDGDAPILLAGDLSHSSKPSMRLLVDCLERLSREIIATPGQHDLPGNTIKNYWKSGMAVLESAGQILVPGSPDVGESDWTSEMWGVSPCLRIYVHAFPWGVPPTPQKDEHLGKRLTHIALCHRMTWMDKPPYPDAPPAGEAKKFLEYMRGYDLVITGDNHQSFSYQGDDGRWLINPGSLMRTTAAQADFQPKVYLWNRQGEVEAVDIPIEEGVVSREHIDAPAERDEKIEAFVKRLRDDVEMGLDFVENVKRFLEAHKITDGVRDAIWEALEEEG